MKPALMATRAAAAPGSDTHPSTGTTSWPPLHHQGSVSLRRKIERNEKTAAACMFLHAGDGITL